MNNSSENLQCLDNINLRKFVFSRKFWPLTYLPPYKKYLENIANAYTKDVVLTYHGNYKISLTPCSMVDFTVLMRGFFSKALTNFMMKNIKEGMICIDLGASIGVFSLLMAEKVGPSGAVYSFEPQPKIFKKLLNNIVLNSLAWVDAYQLALSDKNEQRDLNYPPKGDSNDGAASFGNHLNSSGGSEKVECVTLDSFINQKKISSVDFIKIDVEGHENFVIAGALETLKKYRPLLLIELFCMSRSVQEELLALLTQLGYKFYSLSFLGKEVLFDPMKAKKFPIDIVARYKKD